MDWEVSWDFDGLRFRSSKTRAGESVREAGQEMEKKETLGTRLPAATKEHILQGPGFKFWPHFLRLLARPFLSLSVNI